MPKRALDRQLGVIILAAGAGTRMESNIAKVLHPVAGSPMLSYVLAAARELKPSRLGVVIGYQGEDVKKTFSNQNDIEWIWQKEMRGTGDAVRSATSAFKDFEGPILILYGDIPGVRSETLQRIRMVHTSSQSVATLLTAELEEPTGYGRIVLDAEGSVAKIVEEKDASEEEKEIQEVNTGIGMWESKFLFSSVALLKPTNKQKEFYLTDLVSMARNAGKTIGRLRLRDNLEILGVNSQEDLAEVSSLFYEEKIRTLLNVGVTFQDPSTAYIEPKVSIGKDTTIGASTSLKGETAIGENCKLEGKHDLWNAKIGNGVTLGHGVSIYDSGIGDGSAIGTGTSIGKKKGDA